MFLPEDLGGRRVSLLAFCIFFYYFLHLRVLFYFVEGEDSLFVFGAPLPTSLVPFGWFFWVQRYNILVHVWGLDAYNIWVLGCYWPFSISIGRYVAVWLLAVVPWVLAARVIRTRQGINLFMNRNKIIYHRVLRFCAKWVVGWVLALQVIKMRQLLGNRLLVNPSGDLVKQFGTRLFHPSWIPNSIHFKSW